MSIKSVQGGYSVDCRPQGRSGKRYRKTFKTKAEAMQYERWLITTRNNKEWLDKTENKDKRSLSELIDLWFKHYGRQLKSGEKELKHLKKINKDLGYPKVYQVTKNLFSHYRTDELMRGKKATSINRNHWRLSSVFTVMKNIDELSGEHPLKGLVQLKEPTREMGFLSLNEIEILLNNLTGDALKIAKLSLATGARWSEVANIKGANLIQGKVIFVNTKNGKNRTVPIPEDLFDELSTGKSGRLFKSCYLDFYRVLKELNFDLPKGQAAHVMRHTFASHFIMNGGNILTLQKILGHASVSQTMTYAHLAPDYLTESIKFNPLTQIKNQKGE